MYAALVPQCGGAVGKTIPVVYSSVDIASLIRPGIVAPHDIIHTILNRVTGERETI